jgi:hypothetical protein
MAAAARPWRPRMMSKPISFVMKGGMMDVIVKKTDPQMKMSRRPYTSANLPHSNYFFVSRFFVQEDILYIPGNNRR